MYEFIDEEYATCTTAPTITRMCEWLCVPKSGFYDWRSRPRTMPMTAPTATGACMHAALVLCSGKYRRYGMNLQFIASPEEDIVWVSGPLPGAVHDLNVARIWGILRELTASGAATVDGGGAVQTVVRSGR